MMTRPPPPASTMVSAAPRATKNDAFKLVSIGKSQSSSVTSTIEPRRRSTAARWASTNRSPSPSTPRTTSTFSASRPVKSKPTATWPPLMRAGRSAGLTDPNPRPRGRRPRGRPQPHQRRFGADPPPRPARPRRQTPAPSAGPPRRRHRSRSHPCPRAPIPDPKPCTLPPGGGWRIHGRGNAPSSGAKAGYRYLHTALDDNSRLVYSEILDDERGETAAAFWRRASAWFSSWDITCERVITDNGGCYRSKAWHKAPKRTRTTVKKTRPLVAPNQRQSRTIPPHPPRGMGLHPPLDQRTTTPQRLPRLPPLLQLPPNPRSPQLEHPSLHHRE